MHIQGAFQACETTLIQPIHQLRAREDPAGSRHQDFQQVKLKRGQAGFLSSNLNAMRTPVLHQVPDPQQARRLNRRLHPPKSSPDPG